MDIKKAIKVIEAYNVWRRGDVNLEMTDPTELGIAIDIIVSRFKNLNLANVMPSFSFDNYTKQKGDCDKCVLNEFCKPHCSVVTFEGVRYNCPLKFEENWA